LLLQNGEKLAIEPLLNNSNTSPQQIVPVCSLSKGKPNVEKELLRN